MSAECEGCKAKDDINRRGLRRFHQMEQQALKLAAEVAALKLAAHMKEHDDKEYQFWLERKVHMQRQEINRLLKPGIVPIIETEQGTET